jgi:hypothetical protein
VCGGGKSRLITQFGGLGLYGSDIGINSTLGNIWSTRDNETPQSRNLF